MLHSFIIKLKVSQVPVLEITKHNRSVLLVSIRCESIDSCCKKVHLHGRKCAYWENILHCFQTRNIQITVKNVEWETTHNLAARQGTIGQLKYFLQRVLTVSVSIVHSVSPIASRSQRFKMFFRETGLMRGATTVSCPPKLVPVISTNTTESGSCYEHGLHYFRAEEGNVALPHAKITLIGFHLHHWFTAK